MYNFRHMKVLVVEDERKIAAFLQRSLEEDGHSIDLAVSGETAETLVTENNYDLVILDVMLPGRNGIDTARQMRTDGFSGGLLMLTALSGTRDRIAGLDAGADDYLAKPFEIDELRARIRALMRRSSRGQSVSSILRYQDLEMNLLSRRVRRGEQRISLTQKEFALLEYLLRNAEAVVSRTQIAEHVWDVRFDTGSNFIDVCVNTLRKKIDHGFPVRLIRTVIGVGYMLSESDDR